jgi:hypothetical protein
MENYDEFKLELAKTIGGQDLYKPKSLLVNEGLVK